MRETVYFKLVSELFINQIKAVRTPPFPNVAEESKAFLFLIFPRRD